MPDTSGNFSGKLRHYAHKIYSTMNGFLAVGVDCATFDAYRAWATEAWPNVGWGQFVCAAEPPDDDPAPPPGECTPTTGNNVHRPSNAAVALNIDEPLRSTDGTFGLKLQGDGNLVLRNLVTSSAVWASATDGQGAKTLYLQGDGNLVLRDDSGSALWSTKTGGTGVDRLLVTDSGDMVLLDDGGIVWSARGLATCD